MLPYITQRLFLFFPTLLLLILFTFLLSKWVPGDPVLFHLENPDFAIGERQTKISRQIYRQTAKDLFLDRPNFYFSILPSNFPDTLYLIPRRDRPFLKMLLVNYGYWPAIQEFYSHLESDQISFIAIPSFRTKEQFEQHMGAIYNEMSDNPGSDTARQDLLHHYEALLANKNLNGIWMPKFRWYGFRNQFHRWLTNTISFNFGTSIEDSQPVINKIFRALRWTLIVNIPSLLLAYAIAIPLGLYAGYYRSRWPDQAISFLVFLLYSIPLFWSATMLIVFFSTSEYGEWTNIFPAAGIWESPAEGGFFSLFARNKGQFLIPIICLTSVLVAFITRQLRQAVSGEMEKTYVWQERARGFPEGYILWKSVFKNSSFPLITMMAGLLPASISGALVLEVICNIPGMGRLMYQGIFNRDWNVVLGVIYMSGILTIMGVLLSDILYKWINPRVKFR